MSRQPVRQRPPADDDLTAAPEEEKRRVAEAAARTTKPSVPLSQAGPAVRSQPMPQAGAPRANDRSAYFSGQYSAMSPAGSGSTRVSPEMIADRRLAESGLPDSLRHCVADLIHILRDHGLGEALAALHTDPAIDKKYEAPIRHLLADVDRDERRPRG